MSVAGFAAVSTGLAVIYLLLGAVPLAVLEFLAHAVALTALAGRVAGLAPRETVRRQSLAAAAVSLLALGLLAGAIYRLGGPASGRHRLPLLVYLLLAAVVFCLGLYGLLARRYAVEAVLSLALAQAGACLNLAVCARYLDSSRSGLVFAFAATGLVAVGAGAGLAIVAALARRKGTTDLSAFTDLSE